MIDVDQKVEEALNKPYSRVLVAEEDGGYSARVEEFPGCFAEGDDLLDTLHNLDESMDSWIRSCIDRNYTIPEPLKECVEEEDDNHIPDSGIRIVLDEEGTRRLLEIMENPPKANEKLRKAMREHREEAEKKKRREEQNNND